MIEQTLFQQVLNFQANTSIEGELLFQWKIACGRT
jgi:hypothetical protein